MRCKNGMNSSFSHGSLFLKTFIWAGYVFAQSSLLHWHKTANIFMFASAHDNLYIDSVKSMISVLPALYRDNIYSADDGLGNKYLGGICPWEQCHNSLTWYGVLCCNMSVIIWMQLEAIIKIFTWNIRINITFLLTVFFFSTINFLLH